VVKLYDISKSVHFTIVAIRKKRKKDMYMSETNCIFKFVECTYS